MTETLHHIDVQEQDTVNLMPPEVRDEIVAKIEARITKQVGFITPEELEAALQEGWAYGQTLINGFAPAENALGQMARKICGIGEQQLIDTDHYPPVIDALSMSARAGKRALPQVSHKETSGEVLTAAV